MPSLKTTGRRFESELYTDTGYPFPGVIIPIDEGAVAAYDFTEPRFIMRVRDDCPIHVGTLIQDPNNRIFITGEHDEQFVYDEILNKTFVLFHCNHKVAWERPAETSTDALTGLKRSTGVKTPLGTIDVLIEQLQRENMDTQLRIKEQTRRLITSAPIRLGDIVDNMVVKRIDQFRGIFVAEIE